MVVKERGKKATRPPPIYTAYGSACPALPRPLKQIRNMVSKELIYTASAQLRSAQFRTDPQQDAGVKHKNLNRSDCAKAETVLAQHPDLQSRPDTKVHRQTFLTRSVYLHD